MRAWIATALGIFLIGCSSTVTIAPPRVAQGGRALSIAVTSNNDKRMTVATETGGLFRTFNGGTSWQHLGGLPNYKTIDVAYASLAPDIIIATAQSQYRTINDGGIWRSTDGGATWSQPQGWAPPGPNCPARPSAYGISHMPLSRTFYVGTDCGLAVSNDNGATWTNVILDPQPPNQDALQNRVHSVLVINRTSGVAVGDRGLFHLADNGVWTRALSDPDQGLTPPTHGFASPWWNGSASIFFHASVGQKLFLSTDGGANWSQVDAPSINTREAFVRVARSLSGDDGEFDVYYGDGAKLHRQTFSFDGVTGSGSWTNLKSDHSDPNDIAFDLERREPILLATDGGVHRTTDHGANWKLTGGNYGGFVALQISEITGQSVDGPSPHLQLYYGTQDNDIKGSKDGGQLWTGSVCCEGRFIRTSPASINGEATRVTMSACGACSNVVADANLANARGWPNAPDGSASSPADAPFQIVEDAYLQNVVVPGTPPSNDFFLTLSAGSAWTKSFSLPLTPKGATVFAGSLANPAVYQGVQRPGALTNGGTRFGLMRISNLAGQATVRDADTGLGGVGSLRVPIARYVVFGADPREPDHLIAPDVESKEMKFSTDGGASWHPLPQLTQAVTDYGKYLFTVGELSLASVIAWDPYDSCHILVGTMQNGIIRSTDGGSSWARIKGSTSATFVSSFFFPPTGNVWVSTNGRGLWTLRLGRNGASDPQRCRFPTPPAGPVVQPPIVITAADNSTHEFRGLDDPTICARCSIVVVRNGSVTDYEVKGGNLGEFAISGGTVAQIDRAGREMPLAIPNVYRAGSGKLESRLKGLRMQPTERIRALIVEDARLVAVVASAEELAFAPTRTPMVFVHNAAKTGAPSAVQSGGSVRVAGTNFVPGFGVRILFDGTPVADHVAVGDDGSFAIEVPVTHAPGELTVTVEQRDGQRLTVEKATIDVVADQDEEGESRAL
jgi:photosystem II stability/assembly factor-like uncharacterized protein